MSWGAVEGLAVVGVRNHGQCIVKVEFGNALSGLLAYQQAPNQVQSKPVSMITGLAHDFNRSVAIQSVESISIDIGEQKSTLAVLYRAFQEGEAASYLLQHCTGGNQVAALGVNAGRQR